MTVTQPGTQQSSSAKPPVPLVEVTIDGVVTEVPKGTLVIRAAEDVGIAIPRFCDHPLLKPAGACRQCLVDVAMPDREGNVRPMPKPQASCTLEVVPGMVVNTQLTSETADAAQRGVMEFLLINHPLDCPICDKGGECPLQNQAMSHGRASSRFVDVKRTYPKPLSVSTQVLLDRERCILCQRCTRFSDEIAGDPFIDLQMRGARQQIGAFDEQVLGFDGQAPVGAAETDVSGRPFASYFSGNTIQICPVGALTSAAYRFRARPFDLVSAPAVAEHDACGADIRVDHRRGVVLRRLAGDDPAVNEEWISDKDRFAFHWQSAPDRLVAPLVREPGESGDDTMVETSWADALDVAAGLLAARRGALAALPGGRGTHEDALAWSAFTRTVLGTNDVDFRARAYGDAAEEAVLGAHVAGTGIGVTYADLEHADVLLAGLEPEEEAATIFLRLRKGVLAGTARVRTVAPLRSGGASKLRAELLPAAPGTEAEVLDTITELGGEDRPGVVLVGERLAAAPGALAAAVALAGRTGAALAWVPRRAGDRAALEAGLLPHLLPGGRPVADPAARAEVAAAWGAGDLPQAPGRDLPGVLAALASGELAGVVIGGVDLDDLPDPAAARAALAAVRAAGGVVVSLEVRRSSVTPFADVVLPVAPPSEKSGTYLTWEGRPRPFAEVFTTSAMSDAAVLSLLAAEVGLHSGTGVGGAVEHRPTADLGAGALPAWRGDRLPTAEPVTGVHPPVLGAGRPGRAVLATWKLLLDGGRGQDAEPHLAGTARRAVAHLSPTTAAELGLAGADTVTVVGPHGEVTHPLAVTAMVDGVVWLPSSPRTGEGTGAASLTAVLGARSGETVEVRA
ncbi:NADH-quinone oxidoreductase subunit G [Litorihabitans aurantiacus]|uniref:NADH-quinone oxidoreductase n=1 Tax=Litorihabitans aurantiacus TaxID=1930061 RepID=A0AA37XFZ6_9MICO|nr:NADH-quinone oxidoreductase subunit G [Litorihabitans aurantiacus]GMA32374.1 NADH-quinone oxidoreductase [Litorihabitans aurantiacus]